MSQMTERNLEEINYMEQEAKYTIIRLEDEEEDSTAKQALQDISEKLTVLYSEFRTWLKENAESERVQERKAWLKKESDRLLMSAQEQMLKLKENEDVQQALQKGMKIAADTGVWLYDTVNDGVKEVMKNENVKKLAHNVDDVVQSIKQDERVKQRVVSFKKGTLKLAEHAFHGLQKAFDTENTEESKIEVQENEKNNNL